MSSVQQALLRIRPPRVKITYDVEKGNAIEKTELPFIVGILADVIGENIEALATIKERKFIEINRDNFNAVLESITPKITINVDSIVDKKVKTLRLPLEFHSFNDFHPDSLAQNIPVLKTLIAKRIALIDLASKLDSNNALNAKFESWLLNKEERKTLSVDIETKKMEGTTKWLNEIKLIKPEVDSSFILNLFIELNEVFKTTEEATFAEYKDAYSFLMSVVANLDVQLSQQVDAILHNDKFQKLESSWRGLHKLVHKTETGTQLKLKLLPITKKELYNDLMKAVEFDQSALFKKVYEEEYGTLGGTPYSCLIGDFEFGRSKYDVELLRELSKLAAAAHAPFIGGVSPSMFDLESFSDLGVPRDLASIFESSELAAWHSFRQTEDSRYVSLVLPKVLMRSPYHPSENPCETFNYEEGVNGLNNNHFCWGTPVYELAQKITDAYAQYSWTTAIRGEEGGGKVDSLPTFTYATENGDVELKCPCQVSITDRREKELNNLGFISLCHSKGSDYAVFFSGQTTQKAKKYVTPDATANAALSTKLPYLLNASRFAHYIKMLMRSKIGSFLTAEEVQIYLQNWIAQYVLLSDLGTQEVKAKYPLRMAKITVIDSPEEPGSYKAVILLKPHFQLEELTASLRLVAKI